MAGPCRMYIAVNPVGYSVDLLQMTWVFVVMGNTYDIKLGQWRSDSHSLLSAQELWFAVFMTVL